MAKNKHNAAVGSTVDRSDARINDTGEVFTPMDLVYDIIDQIPDEIMSDPSKIFMDNSCGCGNFLVGLFDRLTNKFGHDKQHVLDHMLFAVDLMEDNVKETCKAVGVEYPHPHFVAANGLEYDYTFDKEERSVFNPDGGSYKFDIIIGNPPYQAPGGTQTGRTIWDKFVALSLDLIVDGGSLLYINPPRWRQPADRLERIYKDNQLVFCWMYTVKEGMKTFGACTNYDVYRIHKVSPTQPTQFRYYDGTYGEADASNLPMIPNKDMDWWLRAFADQGPKLEVICTHTHSPDRKHCSHDKSSEFSIPFIHKMSAKGIELAYTNREHKYQGVTKIAFRDQGKPWATVTQDGCGSHTYFILGDNPEVLSFLNSDRYRTVVDSITFSHRQINYKSLCYIPLGMVLPANK